jgi:hypothetical protein
MAFHWSLQPLTSVEHGCKTGHEVHMQSKCHVFQLRHVKNRFRYTNLYGLFVFSPIRFRIADMR